MTKSRNILAPRRAWSESDLEFLRRTYPDTPTDEIAAGVQRPVSQVYAMAKRLGLVKSEAYLASPAACRLRRGGNVGAEYRFKKGQVPVNKGLKRPGWSSGNMSSTQFKKGEMPHTWVPVGTYRVNKSWGGDLGGCLEIKLSETPGPYTLRWKPVHRHVWEQANGPIPDGHIVTFKPGRKTLKAEEITPDSLELITRAENARRNPRHNYPPEMRQVIGLRAAITRQINKRLKEEAT